MVDNIVLFLMQVKGMSRKTIYKYFRLENQQYSLEDIRTIILEAALNTKKIAVPSMQELTTVYNHYREIVERSNKLGIRIISYLDVEFPIKLKKIDDPPTIIYTKGNIECLNEKAIALIGTREPIEFGAKIAENLGAVLGRDGYIVVSGLAYGCDKFGHIGCLNEKGKTVAVMAGGLDKVYPAKHKELAQTIVESNGCLVSEYPVNTRTFQNYFVERDRLQSGLSEGIIVVETDVKGGTWHTIEYAKKYDRTIGCYRHPVKYLMEKQTLGNQKLLKEKGIISIGDNNDLNEYKQLIDKKHIELMQKNTLVEISQSSFLDILEG